VGKSVVKDRTLLSEEGLRAKVEELERINARLTRDKEQMSQQMESQKNTSLDMAKDYKSRFVMLQQRVEAADARLAESSAAHHLNQINLEKKLSELNTEHGERFKQARSVIQDVDIVLCSVGKILDTYIKTIEGDLPVDLANVSTLVNRSRDLLTSVTI
jgi:hypothetical protein